MSFKAVQAKIAAQRGVSMDRAGAMLASGTRRAMVKRGMSTKHGIPKNVWSKMKKKKRPVLMTSLKSKMMGL